MCIAVISGLLSFVVPKVVTVFESGHAELPMLTQMLIVTSDALRIAGPGILLALALGTVMFLRWIRAPAARHRVDGWLLRLPLAPPASSTRAVTTGPPRRRAGPRRSPGRARGRRGGRAPPRRPPSGYARVHRLAARSPQAVSSHP